MLKNRRLSLELKRKISQKKAQIAVIGLGYVGLPLALSFVKAGFKVVGLDVDKDRIEKLKKGISYITDVKEEELKKAVFSLGFKTDTDFEQLESSDVVIICVPTPLKQRYRPDISYIVSAVKQIKKYLHPGHLIILESTTYPGTTEEVIMPILEKSGLVCGLDFFLAFSPERIDPGNTAFPFSKIPKVLGGVTPESSELASRLYRFVIPKVVRVSCVRVAETVKLLENTFRIVNIGLIDEMAMMCHKMKIDIWEVIAAAKTKPFGFMPFYPGPGVGGHCIPKDPLYLFWKAKKFGFHSRFIKLASDIITYMPQYIVERTEDLLARLRKKISTSKILVLGVTYKKDVLDLRKSPALDIIELLTKKKAEVSYYDPLIPYLKYNQIDLRCIKFTAQNLKKFDCVIIATDHSNVDYCLLKKNARLIFDTRNVYKDSSGNNIFKL